MKQRNQSEPFVPVIGEVNIKIEKPPVWDSICATFQINPIGVFFTYGDTIYNPSGLPIPGEIVEHERVHMKQQKEMGPDIWWGKFLRDPKFRAEQEAEGYARQYSVMAQRLSGQNQKFNYLKHLAELLSGPMYGNCISYMSAILLIRKYVFAQHEKR